MSISNDERITLDRSTFKALASETRVDILKLLEGKQKTVSELARDMNMNKATMYQHLEQLREVGLVKRLDGDERNTTIKADPLEEPTVGPPRKWVYYKLTWKGKNVVNPGKVKFAVMLAVIGIISIAVIALFVASVAFNGMGPLGGSPAEAKDVNPPTFELWSTPEPSTITTDYSFSIEIYDEPRGKITGLQEDSVKIYYGIGDREESGPNVVAWTELPTTHTDTTYKAKITGMDWTTLGGKYLFLKAEARDRSGNQNTTGRELYIVTFKEPDLGFGPGGVKVLGGGGASGGCSITANIVNYGNATSGQFMVSVYTIDPDLDGDGIMDGGRELGAYRLTFMQEDTLDGGRELNMTKQLTSAQLRVAYKPASWDGKLYIVIDPGNELREEREENNIMTVAAPQDVKEQFTNKKAPSAKETMGAAPGFEIVGLIAAMAIVVIIKARRDVKKDE